MTDQPRDLAAIEARYAAYDALSLSSALTASPAAEAASLSAQDVPALVAEVKRLRTKLAAVESLIPNTDEEFPIFPYQLRAAIGARVEDYVLVPAAGLRVGRSAEAERDAALAAVERVRAQHQPCSQFEDCPITDSASCHECSKMYPCPTVRALDPGAEQDPETGGETE